MKSHMKRKHVQDCKYKCNFCNFEANAIVSMYKHKFDAHPEIDQEFRPQTISRTSHDFILNLLAEQNIALMEEVVNLKSELKDFKTEVVNSVVEVREQTKACLSKIVAKSNEDKPLMSAQPPVLPIHKTKAPPSVPDPIRAPRPPTHHVKKKTRYLSKPKILYIGDTVANNADFANVEKATNTRIRTVNDKKPRYSYNNVTDVASVALADTPVEDEYEQMILAPPTEDITNLDTFYTKPTDNIEDLKQKVYTSCKNTFTTAETALKNFPKLKNILIVEHPIRFDTEENDPVGIKPQLAKYANSIYAQLWLESPLKDKVLVCALNVNNRRGAKEHMHGIYGKHILTKSLIDVISNVLPSTRPSKLPNQTSDHTNCPQAMYQRRKKTTYQHNTYPNSYNIPVYNKFSLLGN